MSDKTGDVPYIVHEADMSRLERTIHRMWILLLVMLILLVGSNVAWLAYESQFEDQVITQENESGYNNYVGNDGDIYNGDGYGETND